MSWTTILVLAAGAYLFKALGLFVLGRATRSETDDDTTSQRLSRLLPPALLAALVVSQTVVTETSLVLDARLVGVAAGAVAVWRNAPFWMVLIVAAATTALLRLVSG